MIGLIIMLAINWRRSLFILGAVPIIASSA
jgi:hypothetical protein